MSFKVIFSEVTVETFQFEMMNIKKITGIIIVLLSLFLNNEIAHSQTDNLNQQDLSEVKVDNLTDDQIRAIVERAEESGMTQEQLEYMVLARGLPASELNKLKQRIAALEDGDTTTETSQERGRRIKDQVSVRQTEDLLESIFTFKEDSLTQEEIYQRKIFGFSLFNNKELTFEPSLNIATPENYQLGPGDEVVIDIWGASQQNYSLEINPEGYIFINNLGPIYVGGLTIEKASAKIKDRLKNIYSGMAGANPNTYAQVSLGDLRTIRVNVVGEVNLPGTYSLPSLATVYNALYYAGGPGINGSFRNVKVMRENKEVATLDLYNLLVKGSAEGNIILRDQDVIFVPVYDKRVELKGEVIRPAIYEAKQGESVADVLAMAGGFTGNAYKERLRIFRKSAKEHTMIDITSDRYNQTVVENGDAIEISPILNRYQNRVEIAGAVYREGIYQLHEGMTVKELILTADGLREDAFGTRGSIYRRGSNMKTTVVPFDPLSVINGQTNDIQLKDGDYVNVPSIFDMEEEMIVNVEGAVLKPGDYPYYEDITLGDMVITAGGLLESASLAKIEVARRIKNQRAEEPSAEVAKVFQFSISKDLKINDEAAGFVLEPFDMVFIRKSPGYEEQQVIQVEGEVAFPGSYVISNKNDRISDIIKRTGGLTPDAYVPGARLIRKIEIDEEERQKALEAIMRESEDTVDVKVETETEQAIGIELEKILAQPHSKYDILLQDGDQLVIPKQLQTIRLSGALLYPATVRYEANKSLRSYVGQAGGFADNAKEDKAYVIYANGSVARTRKILFFNDYPKIEPGAEIVVPTKPEREGMSAQELVGLTSVLSSTALVIVTIINNLNSN
jgi:protein involved in polysaccharide export with SLBB domain